MRLGSPAPTAESAPIGAPSELRYARFVTSHRLFRTTVSGEIRFKSRMFSNVWVMTGTDGVIARMQRIPSTHTSRATLGDGTRLEIKPEGWGTVIAAGDSQKAKIVRGSWWGRRWAVSGTGFSYDLTSDPMPRRWTLRIGGHPVARIAGTLWSYNRMIVQADVAVPIHALILSWHVLARPWEAAAAPGSLRPKRPPALR